MEQKYNLEYDNICVLFYRGNDKQTETYIPCYNDIIERAKNKFDLLKFSRAVITPTKPLLAIIEENSSFCVLAKLNPSTTRSLARSLESFM